MHTASRATGTFRKMSPERGQRQQEELPRHWPLTGSHSHRQGVFSTSLRNWGFGSDVGTSWAPKVFSAVPKLSLTSSKA